MRSGNSSSFKMMGSSPAKGTTEKGIAKVRQYAEGEKHIGTKRSPEELRDLAARADKAGNKDAAKKMRDKAVRAKTEKERAAEHLKKDSPADLDWGKIGKTVGKAALGPAGLLL